MKFNLFLLLSLVPLLLKAQEQDSLNPALSKPKSSLPQPKIKYKSLSVSLPYKKIRDEGHSPLTHRGPSIQLAAFNERLRSKNGKPFSNTKLEFIIGIGLLSTNKKKVDALTRASALYMEINYHALFPFSFKIKNKIEWLLGGIFSNTFDGRYYSSLQNNSFGYEFSNSLNPATEFRYPFVMGKSERKYQMGFKLNTALLSHVVRPNFIGMEPAETYMEEKIRPFEILTNGNKLVLPNRFFKLTTEIYLDRFNKITNDKYRIYYGWGIHITKLEQSNPLYIASHTIGVIRMLYSKKELVKSKN